MSNPRVYALTGKETGCTLWRTFFPFPELQKRGHLAYFDDKDSDEAASIERMYLMATRLDAVILPRMSWSDHAAAESFFGRMHACGLCVIYEVDDDAFSPAIVQRQYNNHQVERDKGLEQLEQDRLDRIRAMQMCDGVTVTTRRLKTIVGQYTEKPVEVVPNAIDLNYWRAGLRGWPRRIPPITIGWAGGNRYAEDLEPVGKAWARIAVRYPSVTFVVVGHESPALVASVPADRIKVMPWLDFKGPKQLPDGRWLPPYPAGLRNIDIACCSVAPKLFNTAKTPIKLWEMTMSGAACVVSPTLYGSSVADGEDGLIAENADEWEAALSRLIEDEPLRKRLRKAQRRRVATEHSMEANWQNWPRAWSNLIEDFRYEQQRPRLVLAS